MGDRLKVANQLKPPRAPASGQDRRLSFIDFRLLWEGRINRSDLMEHFGISIPQASLDLARYQALAPNNAYYDRNAKAYLATEQFQAATPVDSSTSFLGNLLAIASGATDRSSTFHGWMPDLDTVQPPMRQVGTSILRKVLFSIRVRRELTLSYQSMFEQIQHIDALALTLLRTMGFAGICERFVMNTGDSEILCWVESSRLSPMRQRMWTP